VSTSDLSTPVTSAEGSSSTIGAGSTQNKETSSQPESPASTRVSTTNIFNPSEAKPSAAETIAKKAA